MAEWLDTAFSLFDEKIIRGIHTLSSGFSTGLFKTITFLGEKCILFLIIAVILMLFKNTRRAGVCMFGAVAIGYLLSNIIIKNLVARQRPYESSATYYAFFNEVKASLEKGYSFPSGHATGIASFATALFITCNKKWSYIGFIATIIMGISRIYLMAHYPTDVIGGIILGIVCGVLSYLITHLIYYILEKNKDKKFFAFILDFDIRKILTKGEKS